MHHCDLTGIYLDESGDALSNRQSSDTVSGLIYVNKGEDSTFTWSDRLMAEIFDLMLLILPRNMLIPPLYMYVLGGMI